MSDSGGYGQELNHVDVKREEGDEIKEVEILDPVEMVWLDDIPLSDVLEPVAEDYDISGLIGVRPEREVHVGGNEAEIQNLNNFTGVGIEMEQGPVAYLEHPLEGGQNRDYNLEWRIDGYVEPGDMENDSWEGGLEEAVEMCIGVMDLVEGSRGEYYGNGFRALRASVRASGYSDIYSVGLPAEDLIEAEENL